MTKQCHPYHDAQDAILILHSPLDIKLNKRKVNQTTKGGGARPSSSRMSQDLVGPNGAHVETAISVAG